MFMNNKPLAGWFSAELMGGFLDIVVFSVFVPSFILRQSGSRCELRMLKRSWLNSISKFELISL